METACENKQMVELTEKDFKVAIINLFEELKETMVKEVKKDMMIMSQEIDNTDKEIDVK